MEHTPLRTSVCRKSDMRRREWDKRSVRSDVSFEGPAIIRAGGIDTLMLQATPDMGRTRWILVLCAWTIVGLLFAVRRIVVAIVQGTHVSWLSVAAPELVYWYVCAAYTPLVIGLAKRYPGGIRGLYLI